MVMFQKTLNKLSLNYKLHVNLNKLSFLNILLKYNFFVNNLYLLVHNYNYLPKNLLK